MARSVALFQTRADPPPSTAPLLLRRTCALRLLLHSKQSACEQNGRDLLFFVQAVELVHRCEQFPCARTTPVPWGPNTAVWRSNGVNKNVAVQSPSESVVRVSP